MSTTNGGRDTVVFDVGRVLIEWDPRHLYRSIFAGDEDKVDWFLTHVVTGAWNLEQDRGRSFADAIALLVRDHPAWEDEIRAFDTRWHEMVPDAIHANVAVLHRLQAAGVPTYAITNFSREKWAESTARFAFLTSFDGAIVSAHEGILKPDPAIYRLLQSRHGLDLKRCLFIDDSPKNVAAAADLGMAVIHYTGDFDLAEAVAEAGFPAARA